VLYILRENDLERSLLHAVKFGAAPRRAGQGHGVLYGERPGKAGG